MVFDFSTRKYYHYPKEKVVEGVAHLQKADIVVGQNIIDYDIPVLQKFFPLFVPKKVVDTLVWSRLAYPDIMEVDLELRKKGRIESSLMGRHSLEAWGQRLGESKGDFAKTTDWQEWSPEMEKYCEQDVRVTLKLWQKLVSKSVSKEALKLEHQVQTIICRQMANGFWFDIDAAEELYAKLIEKRLELEEKLKGIFGTWIEPKGPVKTAKVNNKRYGYIKGCQYQKIKYVTFNPNSRTHIYKCLIKKYGWKPQEFTDSGQPKVDDTIIKALPYPEAKPLSEYLMLTKRINQIAEGEKAWIKFYNRETHRIHGYVNTGGTATGRMSHSNPNVSQVPASYSPYGAECRDLWRPRPGWWQVGADASGLELRCLAHYLAKYDNGRYAHIILKEDIHVANQLAAGLLTRDQAKTFIYMYIYGAGNAALGATIGGGSKEGKEMRSKFLKKIEGLKQLKEQVEKIGMSRGYLKGLDGRSIPVDLKYKALNRLLQSAGGIVMKKALVIMDEDFQQDYVPGKDYEFMVNSHDEVGLECRTKEIAEDIGKRACQAITKAGEFFNFRCPLAGEYKVGKSWRETH